MLPNYISQLFHTCENSDYDLRSNNLKLSQTGNQKQIF